MRLNDTFKPTKKQQELNELLSRDVRHSLVYGGGRSGKSLWIILCIILRAMKAPNSNHLVARKTFQSVKKSLWYKTFDDVMRLCFPEELRKNMNENKDMFFKELPNGSRIHFAGLDDKDRVDKILGNEYSTIFYNECTELTWDAVSTVNSRLAERNDGIVNKIFYDCNPTASNHWTYRLFIAGQQPETGMDLKNKDDFQHFRMNPADNLDNIDKAYLEDMENAPEDKRRRFLLGEFAVGGDVAIYKEEWFHHYTTVPAIKYLVWVWDTAQKDKEYNDPTCGLLWAVAEEGYYLMDIVNERMTYPDLKKKVIDCAERYRADEVLIEDRSSGTSLIQDLCATTKLPIVPIQVGKQKKVERAMYSSNLFEQKNVFLPVLHESIQEYKSQLLMFPMAEHDDMVDATSLFLGYAKDNLMYELPASHYEDEVDTELNLGYDFDETRNAITGY